MIFHFYEDIYQKGVRKAFNFSIVELKDEIGFIRISIMSILNFNSEPKKLVVRISKYDKKGCIFRKSLTF